MKEQILSMGVQFIIGVLGIVGKFCTKESCRCSRSTETGSCGQERCIIITIVLLVLQRGYTMPWRMNLRI
ncbi:hypothetical protein [Clostridium kluyveri]|uniref:hypothetical protein n=1 Tax=Clostridium kluyveri TaxID=1534 RepID=UPI002248033A|nr:hypothetical protein [Clostridium kluyveri]UZQ49562.1 hypothetical protein OP486_16645 [Clostridium kluyveri]